MESNTPEKRMQETEKTSRTDCNTPLAAPPPSLSTQETSTL